MCFPRLGGYRRQRTSRAMWMVPALLRVLPQIAFWLGAGSFLIDRRAGLLPRALSLSTTTTTVRGRASGDGGGNNNRLEIHRTIQELQQTTTTTTSSTKPRSLALASSSSSKISSSLPPEYESTTRDVIQILQFWEEEYRDDPNWKSLLNKANLRHEVEESIVALHHLLEWRRREKVNHANKAEAAVAETATMSSSSPSSSSSTSKFIALDACCGKGLFGTLLSYLAPPGLTRVILFDNNQQVDWSYIDSANRNHKQQGRPFIECWPGFNIHDHDLVVDKLLQQQQQLYDDDTVDDDNISTVVCPIAVTGIHLCKTLSPTLIGIVNSLGSTNAPYMCLVPCCLPRRQQKLQIALYETPLQRQGRLAVIQRRSQTKQRGRSSCYVCHGQHHVRDCPERSQYSTPEEWNHVVEQALLSKQAFCWNCGKEGHRKSDCKEPRVSLQKQPTTLLEMSSCIYPTQEEPSLLAYCKALGETLQQHNNVNVIDSRLTTSHQGGGGSSTKKKRQQGTTNWNGDRKSLYIVATK